MASDVNGIEEILEDVVDFRGLGSIAWLPSRGCFHGRTTWDAFPHNPRTFPQVASCTSCSARTGLCHPRPVSFFMLDAVLQARQCSYMHKIAQVLKLDPMFPRRGRWRRYLQRQTLSPSLRAGCVSNPSLHGTSVEPPLAVQNVFAPTFYHMGWTRVFSFSA